MARAAQRRAWAPASSLMALIANCHRDPKKRRQPYEPADFDPTREAAPDEPLPVGEVRNLKRFLPANHPARQRR